jgi:hypothetical protein
VWSVRYLGGPMTGDAGRREQRDMTRNDIYELTKMTSEEAAVKNRVRCFGAYFLY